MLTEKLKNLCLKTGLIKSLEEEVDPKVINLIQGVVNGISEEFDSDWFQKFLYDNDWEKPTEFAIEYYKLNEGKVPAP